MNKTFIAPIIVMVLFYLKTIFGIELPDETANITVDGVWAIISLVMFWRATQRTTQQPTKPPDNDIDVNE